MTQQRKPIVKEVERLTLREAKHYTKKIAEEGVLSVPASVQNMLLRDFMVMYTRAIFTANYKGDNK